MRLPENKKLVKVTFQYEDGSIFVTNEESSLNFQENLNATGTMALRGHNFKPVEWEITSNSEYCSCGSIMSKRCSGVCENDE
jgi:hypothetical protein